MNHPVREGSLILCTITHGAAYYDGLTTRGIVTRVDEEGRTYVWWEKPFVVCENWEGVHWSADHVRDLLSDRGDVHQYYSHRYYWEVEVY